MSDCEQDEEESKNKIKQSPKQQLMVPLSEQKVLPHNSGLQRQQTCGINPDDFEEMPEGSDDDDEGPPINRVLIQPQRELNCHANNLKAISQQSSEKQNLKHQGSKFSCFNPQTSKMNSIRQTLSKKRNNTYNEEDKSKIQEKGD